MTQRVSGQPTTTDLVSDLDHGFSLPASWYTDPAIVDLEHERIFRHSWQYVGRSAQVSNVGDYFVAMRVTSESCSAHTTPGPMDSMGV